MTELWFWSLKLGFKALLTVELMHGRVLLSEKGNGRGLVVTSEC